MSGPHFQGSQVSDTAEQTPTPEPFEACDLEAFWPDRCRATLFGGPSELRSRFRSPFVRSCGLVPRHARWLIEYLEETAPSGGMIEPVAVDHLVAGSGHRAVVLMHVVRYYDDLDNRREFGQKY